MATCINYEYTLCWLNSNGELTSNILKAEDEATAFLYHNTCSYYIPYEWVMYG